MKSAKLNTCSAKKQGSPQLSSDRLDSVQVCHALKDAVRGKQDELRVGIYREDGHVWF